MPSARLFGAGPSPFVAKVRKALELKGIAYEVVGVRAPGDFKRWNPIAQKMPVLEIDGEKVWDSTFILRRLDAVAPEPKLVSGDPAVAASQTLLEDWADESLYWYVMALRGSPSNARASTEQVVGGMPALLRPIMRRQILRSFRRNAWNQGLGRLPEPVLLDEFGRRLDEVASLLGERPFLLSDRPSVADLAVWGQLQTLRSGPTPDADAAIQKRAALVDWMARVDAAGA